MSHLAYIEKHKDKLIEQVGEGWCREMATVIVYMLREKGVYCKIASGAVMAQNKTFCIMSHEWVRFERPVDGIIDLAITQANVSKITPKLEPIIGRQVREDIQYVYGGDVSEEEYQRRMRLGLFLQDGRHFTYSDYLAQL